VDGERFKQKHILYVRLCVTALGQIGITTPVIRNAILWAFRFENDSAVRSEACHTAYKLHLTGDDVIGTLQERYLVESSERDKR